MIQDTQKKRLTNDTIFSMTNKEYKTLNENEELVFKRELNSGFNVGDLQHKFKLLLKSEKGVSEEACNLIIRTHIIIPLNNTIGVTECFKLISDYAKKINLNIETIKIIYDKMVKAAQDKIKITDKRKQPRKTETKTDKKPNVDFNFGAFTDFLAMADKFITLQPISYDSNKIWEAWNFKTSAYKIIDEIDLLNSLNAKANTPGVTINSKTRGEILEALRQRGRLNRPKEPKTDWIQFGDMIVDVKTKEQFKATPKYHFTCPIPHKLGDSEDTPTMDRLFNEWVVGGDQDETFIQTLYEIIAYSTLRRQFLQRLFAFNGSGSNGKGCFLKLLTNFLGTDNISSTEMKVLTQNNFASSVLYNKQAVIMGEVDVYDMKNTNLLKALTGEDKLRFEFKGKDSFSAESFCTCFIATNSLPITPDNSDGFYRRWQLVDFPNQFETGRDVVGEIPAIEYNNLAKKCVRIAGELYQTMKFTNEGNIIDRKKKYEARSNPVKHFLENYCEDAPNEDLKFSEFCNIFFKYLTKNKQRLMNKKLVAKALRNEGYVMTTKNVEKVDGTKTKAFFIFDLQEKSINSINSINFSIGSL